MLREGLQVCPHCFARKFGLVQSIPKILTCPIYLLVTLCTSCQSTEIFLALKDIEDKLHSFVFRHFSFSPNNVDFFTKWWGVISTTVFLGLATDFLTS